MSGNVIRPVSRSHKWKLAHLALSWAIPDDDLSMNQHIAMKGYVSKQETKKYKKMHW